jgi:hypothetical protein
MREAKTFSTQSKGLNKIILGGFRRGEITCVASRFAVGKSWILINLFHHLLKQKKAPVFISLDLPIASIWRRLIMIESKMSFVEYIRAFQNGKGTEKWELASERLSAINPRIQYRKNSFTAIPAYLKEAISDKSDSVIFLDGLMFPKTRVAKKYYDGELKKIRSVLENKNATLVMSLGLGRTFAKGQKIDFAKVEAKVLSGYFNKLIVLQNGNNTAADSMRKMDCLLIDQTTKKTKKTAFPIYIDDRIGIIYDKNK